MTSTTDPNPSSGSSAGTVWKMLTALFAVAVQPACEAAFEVGTE